MNNLLILWPPKQAAQYIEDEHDENKDQGSRPREFDLIVERHAGEVVDQDRKRGSWFAQATPRQKMEDSLTSIFDTTMTWRIGGCQRSG
jgi:hypothetical protein